MQLHTSVADPSCHFDADPDLDAACHFDADPDPTFHFDADPDADPSFQVKALILERCSSTLLFHTFWLFICKLMRIRNRIQPLTFRRIRILHFNLMRIRGSGFATLMHTMDLKLVPLPP
jgi:hypothetical protein